MSIFKHTLGTEENVFQLQTTETHISNNNSVLTDSFLGSSGIASFSSCAIELSTNDLRPHTDQVASSTAHHQNLNNTMKKAHVKIAKT
jgi:hypothetical protein